MGFLVLGNYIATLQNVLSAGTSIQVLMNWLYWLGWAQFAILFVWIGSDGIRRYLDTRRSSRNYALNRVEP